MSAAKAPNDEIQFPAWVPPAARQRITDLRATPLGQDDTGRRLLKRLATYEVMKTEVWKKLPSSSRNIHRDIIDWAFTAYTIFPSLRRPYPKTKHKWSEWAKHITKHPPLPELNHQASLANELRNNIFKVKDQTQLYWPRFWEGNECITPDRVLVILEQLNVFYLRMDEEYRALLASLPKIKRWTRKGWQKFFTEYLSKHLIETYDQPHDLIVAALLEVAFDLEQGVYAETVRGRRRTVATPEKSKRKSS